MKCPLKIGVQEYSFHLSKKPFKDLKTNTQSMSRQRTRRQTRAPIRSARRAINKQLVNTNINTIVAAQQSTTLETFTFPVTLTGLRWDINVLRSAGTAGNLSRLVWAIIMLPDSQTASTISLTNAGSVYQPEQHVLAYGTFLSDGVSAAGAAAHSRSFNGSSKTMRKLQSGDKLELITFGTATEAHELFGTIQWFEKT